MNVKHLIAAVAVLASGSALADNTYPYVDHSSFTGTKTRAEVRTELERLHAEGNHVANRTPEFVEFTHVASTRSREEVRAEAIQAGRGGAPNGTSSGS